MNLRKLLGCFTAAGLLLAAGAMAQDREETPQAKVYDAGELSPSRYTIIERLWTGTWRASFWIPSYGEAGEAVAALTDKATRLGADGVVNLHCLNDTGGWGGGYYCYGLAIKLK